MSIVNLHKFLGIVLLVSSVTILTACEKWQKVSTEPVQAEIIRKYSRKPSKGSRRYVLEVKHGVVEGRIRVARLYYNQVQVGQDIRLCLTMYYLEKTKERRSSLDKCPEDQR